MSTPIKVSKADKKLIKSKIVASLTSLATIKPATAVSDATVSTIQSIGQNAVVVSTKLAKLTKGKKDEASMLLMEQIKNHGKHLVIAFEDGEADKEKVRAYKTMAHANMESLLERLEAYIIVDKPVAKKGVSPIKKEQATGIKPSSIWRLGDMSEDEIERLAFKDAARQDEKNALHLTHNKIVMEKNAHFLESMPTAENTAKFAATKLPVAPLFEDLYLSADVLQGLNIISESLDGYTILMDQLLIVVNVNWAKANGYTTLEAAQRILKIIESKSSTKYGFVSEIAAGHRKAKGLAFFWAMPEKQLNKFLNMIQKRGSGGLSEWGLAL